MSERKNVFLTGATGFLGSHLTRQLVARDADVRVLLRPSSNNRAIADLSLEYMTGDLRDVASLDRALGCEAAIAFQEELDPLATAEPADGVVVTGHRVACLLARPGVASGGGSRCEGSGSRP